MYLSWWQRRRALLGGMLNPPAAMWAMAFELKTRQFSVSQQPTFENKSTLSANSTFVLLNWFTPTSWPLSGLSLGAGIICTQPAPRWTSNTEPAEPDSRLGTKQQNPCTMFNQWLMLRQGGTVLQCWQDFVCLKTGVQWRGNPPWLTLASFSRWYES